MILQAIRDDDGDDSLLVLEGGKTILVTLVVTLSSLAHAGSTVAVVGRRQLYLRNTN